MQRELKFRVWDDRLNIFNYFNVTTVGGHLPMDCLTNVQQFTGIKDRRGKEIYEGDIVQIEGHLLPEKVIFLNGSFGVHLNYKNSPDPRRSDSDNGDFEPICDLIYHMKVIGNIFETPELLKN
jgi:uncharacterized phage protein (TIGR01671 family)